MRSEFVATEYHADRMHCCWETIVISRSVACVIRKTFVLHPKVLFLNWEKTLQIIT